MRRDPDIEALDQAARAAIDRGCDLDTFVEAAWAAYVAARPGMREQLEERQWAAQLEMLRRRGLVPSA